MCRLLCIFVITYCGFHYVTCQDEIAPGIPPQQYQQYQQSMPQTAQMHHLHSADYQVADKIHGYKHQSQQVLNVANIAQEKKHIAEHLDVPIDTNKMSEQELQFHYFKMHDSDNNNKLDGCELIKSLIHWHEEGNKESSDGSIEEKIFKDEELITLIDPILQMDDINQDGFIDYPEFIQAQQRTTSTS